MPLENLITKSCDFCDVLLELQKSSQFRVQMRRVVLFLHGCGWPLAVKINEMLLQLI